MKLYYTPATCSQAIHIMLREYGADFDLVKVDLHAKALPDGSPYAAVNPKAKIPALVDDSGILHTEAAAILHELPSILGNSKAQPPERQLEWLVFLTSELHRSFSPLYRPDTPAAYAEIARANIRNVLTYLDRYLAGRDTILDSGFGPADAYLFVMLGWALDRGVPFDDLPALVAFRARIVARPTVQASLSAEGLV